MCGCLSPGKSGPKQGSLSRAVEWQEFRLQGQEWLAERASKKLKNDGLLVVSMAGAVLRFEIDRFRCGGESRRREAVGGRLRKIPLSAPRQKRSGASRCDSGWRSRLTWLQEPSRTRIIYDAATERYRGLEAGRRPTVQLNATSVVVKPEVAVAQIQKDSTPPPTTTPTEDGSSATGTPSTRASGTVPSSSTAGGTTPAIPGATRAPILRRFHSSAKIDATRLSRDVDVIASSIIKHLAGLLDARVKITIEIEAEIPSGAPKKHRSNGACEL